MEISTPVYVNPLSDSGFKAIFCDPANKCDLIALLNVFLRPAGRQVEDLEYATTELPGVALSNKASRVDLRCTDASGSRFIVEVQRGAQPRFFRRCVYYASRIYALGSERGDGERYEILPVYLVALTDRDFGFARGGREWAGRYTSVYTFREKSTGQEEDETISIIFVELNRFEKGSYGECASDEERWCWTLKNMSGMGRGPGDTGATLEQASIAIQSCDGSITKAAALLRSRHTPLRRALTRPVRTLRRRATGFAPSRPSAY